MKELNNLEKVSWEEQRIDDQQMDIEGDTKESSQEAQMYEEQILDDRSRFRDEKVIMKEKQMEEEEIKYQEKKKIESESAKKVEKKKSQKKRKKKSIKGKQAQPTSKQLPPKFRNVPENVKPFVNEDDVVLEIIPDGAFGFNAPSAHIFEDQKEGQKLRHVINVHIVDQW